jgi:cell division protein FtsQ
MDGRGRLVEPLTRPGATRPAARAAAPTPPPGPWRGRSADAKTPSRISRFVRFCAIRLEEVRIPRFAGAAASVAFLVASIGYGAVRGGHVPMIVDSLKDWRDAGANALGFHIAAVSLAGEKHVGRAEIVAAAGVTERTSLLFLDVDAARARLKAIPWIADASVRKLFPDRLQIRIREREPFAVWQVDGKAAVIAADGTVVSALNDAAFAALPLVVGRGAQAKARDFLALLDRYPMIRNQVRASVLVADRRWNLKLKNDVDVRLPEEDVGGALDRLVALDRGKKLLDRDITAVDLRLPDRVTVRLSDGAAQAREEARKSTKRKGGDA